MLLYKAQSTIHVFLLTLPTLVYAYMQALKIHLHPFLLAYTIAILFHFPDNVFQLWISFTHDFPFNDHNRIK